MLKLPKRFQQRYCHYSLNNSSKVVDLDQLAPASASASASALACSGSALKKCLEFYAVAEAFEASAWLFASGVGICLAVCSARSYLLEACQKSIVKLNVGLTTTKVFDHVEGPPSNSCRLRLWYQSQPQLPSVWSSAVGVV